MKTRLCLYLAGSFILVFAFSLFLTNTYTWTDNKAFDEVYNLPAGVSRKREVNGVLNEEALYALSTREVSRIYYDYVNTQQVKCGNVIRAGNHGDGGWDLCMDPAYKPTTPCLVYSFGINNDFSFDDEMAERYACEVHSYDPSMKKEDHLRGQRVHFHPTGLFCNNSVYYGWPMKTFSTFLKDNRHSNNTIDVLKIDIERSELQALPEMLKSGSLKNVKQLCFEMHVKLNRQREPDKEKYISVLSLLLDLYKEGFRIFGSHRNMFSKYMSIYGMERTGCHEIYMIRQLDT